VGYDEIEECTQPCALVLPWAVTELPHMVMAHEALLSHYGSFNAFQYYRQFLQVLAYQTPGSSLLFHYIFIIISLYCVFSPPQFLHHI
jgi:hypothetical protein